MDLELYKAEKSGNTCILTEILNENPSLLAQLTPQENTPLHIAVQFGHVTAVAEIFYRCKSLLIRPKVNGDTPLHVAARLILKLACLQNHAGESPLFLAAREGRADIVSNHLHYITGFFPFNSIFGIEVNATPINCTCFAPDKNGHSPLHVAAEKGHTNVIEQIIFYCQDSGELLDLNGKNALHSAIVNGKANAVRHTWILRYLMWDRRVNQRAKNKKGQTVFDINKSIRESYITSPENIIKNFSEKLGSGHTLITKNHEPTYTLQTHNYRQTGQTFLMVATLITTVTFTAAFAMPGGYNNYIGYDQGKALLQSSKQLIFFITTDSIAMTCSITAACITFWGAIGSNESYVYYFASAAILTYVALITTGMAFSTGISAVLPDQHYFITIAYSVMTVFHFSTCFLLLKLVQIFPFSEVCQFLNSHLQKMNLIFMG
ncbi:ankyrin repeat-containing protein, putative [Ricinus communis]|uniref:Ankyrin repeat-containing protein, putative n=1 Tax=Ricinus communis TaxID=3988 RepID=B9SA20_RICCO|nr:ankyrin repeat-containing protein, putative [Ricinus communis]